jgi:hypothetical protein
LLTETFLFEIGESAIAVGSRHRLIKFDAARVIADGFVEVLALDGLVSLIPLVFGEALFLLLAQLLAFGEVLLGVDRFAFGSGWNGSGLLLAAEVLLPLI